MYSTTLVSNIEFMRIIYLLATGQVKSWTAQLYLVQP